MDGWGWELGLERQFVRKIDQILSKTANFLPISQIYGAIFKFLRGLVAFPMRFNHFKSKEKNPI